MGLFRTVSEINSDIDQKSQIVPPRVFNATVKGVLEMLYRRYPVTWSESVDLRIKPVCLRPKKIGLGLGLASCGLGLGLGLAVLVLFCETRS